MPRNNVLFSSRHFLQLSSTKPIIRFITLLLLPLVQSMVRVFYVLPNFVITGILTNGTVCQLRPRSSQPSYLSLSVPTLGKPSNLGLQVSALGILQTALHGMEK